MSKPARQLKTFLPKYATCKAIVGKFLAENERTRGSDKLLIDKVDSYCRKHGFRRFSHESITRARRKYNESGLYLPSPKTRACRKNKERAYREASKEGVL